MANELQIGANLTFIKGGANFPQRSLAGRMAVAGTAGIHNLPSIGTTDESLALGDVATNGYLLLNNLEAYVEVTTPAAPTVTPAGTTGAATWSYKIVAKQTDGSYSAASAAGTTTTGTGLAGNAATPPATGVDNVILIGADGSSYPVRLKGGDFALFRFNGAVVHAKGSTIACKLEYILISD